jgi:hypothetical protein
MNPALLTAFLLTAAAPATDAALHVQVADTLSCPSAAQLIEALDQRLGPGRAILGEKAPGVAVMEVFAAEGTRFTVRLTSTSARLTAEQTLDAHRGSCLELARAVALLAESWLRDMPKEKDLVGLTPPPEPEAAAPRPLPQPAVVRTTPQPEHHGYVPHLTIMASADWVVSTSNGLGVTGIFEVALPVPRLSVGAEFSLLPQLSGTSGTGSQAGTITVSRYCGALTASYLLLPMSPGTGLSLVAGLLLLVTPADATGSFALITPKTAWEFGGEVGVRFSLPFPSKQVFLYGEADGQFVPQRLNFQVDEVTIVAQPNWWLSFSGGLGWRFL